jgi:hypothetical protein
MGVIKWDVYLPGWFKSDLLKTSVIADIQNKFRMQFCMFENWISVGQLKKINATYKPIKYLQSLSDKTKKTFLFTILFKIER